MLGLVIGGGDCPWCDLERLADMTGLPTVEHRSVRACFLGRGYGPHRGRTAHRIPVDWPGFVVAVNDVGCHYPGRLDGWASLHPNKFPAWTKRRKELGHAPALQTFGKASQPAQLMTRRLPHRMGGSSGLFGVMAARVLGASRVILCGVPMSVTPHFADSEEHQYGKHWRGADQHWKRWKRHYAEIGDVRSMSGRTMDLLGPPDTDWIAWPRNETLAVGS